MNNQERRRFHRILFDAPCELHQAESAWQTQVTDLSLKGVLVKRPADWSGDINIPFEVVIHLEDGTAIVMAVQLKHLDQDQLGFGCQYIDLESATHLRRLVELNLGHDLLLHRDLLELGTS